MGEWHNYDKLEIPRCFPLKQEPLSAIDLYAFGNASVVTICCIIYAVINQ